MQTQIIDASSGGTTVSATCAYRATLHIQLNALQNVNDHQQKRVIAEMDVHVLGSLLKQNTIPTKINNLTNIDNPHTAPNGPKH